MIRCPRIAAVLGVSFAMVFFCPPASAVVVHLRVDPGATQIVASVNEPIARIRGAASGTFTVITGKIEGDPANPAANGRVEIVIDATSYSSGSAHRDKVVMRDALEAPRFPVVTFVSTRIEDLKWEVQGVDATATVVGNLTLHGVTREVRVRIDATLSPDRHLSADGDLRFDFTDFGVKPPSTLFGALKTGTVVDLNFRVIAVPADQFVPAPTPTPQ